MLKILMKASWDGIYFFKKYILRTSLYISIIFSSACNGLFYHPSEHAFYNPEKLGHTPRLIEFHNKKKTKLYGWLFEAKSYPIKGTVIQFHGNAENITSHFLFLLWMTYKGYNVFTFDYSGYGMSDGEPSPENMRLDAIAAYNWLESQIKNDDEIILFAQSLGVAVLVNAYPDFIKKSKVKAVILDSGFYSYQAIAKEKLAGHWLTWPFQALVYPLISDEYTPEPFFSKISPTPTLLIHGKKDFVIPFNHAEKIFQLLKEPKYFWGIDSGRHTDAMSGHNGAYQKKLIEFLDGL